MADDIRDRAEAGAAGSEAAGGARRRLATPANIVTCSRLALMPAWLALAEVARSQGIHSGTAVSWAALAMYMLISLTDKLDGWLARSRGEVTDFGKVMDPLADKVSVSLGIMWLIECGLAPSWMLLLVLAREFLVSGLRMLVASKGTIVAASGLGRAKTATTMVGICALMAFATLPLSTGGAAGMASGAPTFWWVQVAGDICMWVAMALTAWSGLDYAVACWPAMSGGEAAD